MKLTLLQMRSFLALADTLSFTAAAERLRIRQSTLSATIRNFETAVGGRLFDRDTRKVRLTPLGHECKRLAIRLLDEADRTEAELRRHVLGECGSLRIAVNSNIFPALIAPALAEFREAYPDVSLQFSDVTGDEAVHQLRHGQADLVIAHQVGDDSDLRYQFLDEQRFVALLPERHGLAGRNSIAWTDLLSETLIIVQSRDSVGVRVAQILLDAGIEPRIDHRVNTLITAVGLVDAGFGIALLGHHSAEHALRPGLVIRDLREPSITGRICMITLAASELSKPLVALHRSLSANVARRKAGAAPDRRRR